MALTNKLEAIADAVREKTGGTAAIALENIAEEISTIPSTAFEGEYIPPAESAYPIAARFSAIGNAIRAKTGGEDALTLDEMPDAIRSIDNTPRNPTSALSYSRNEEGTGYEVISLYDPDKTITDVVIAKEYNGLPVVGIAAEAFNDSSKESEATESNHVKSFYIPDGVTHIGEEAFFSLSSARELVNLRLPNTLTSIGDYAFYRSSKMVGLTIPNSVTYIGAHAFEFCNKLTKFNIPSGVTEITPYMLASCSSLTSLEVPEGVTTIGDYAFYACSNLKKVVLPSTITSIGQNAFSFVGSNGWCHVYVPWSQGAVAGAPWAANYTNITIHYNYGGEQ